MPHRLRFAPSPTGYLHVGGARTALFNYLFAKATGGKFLLRIEDTDKARSTDASTEAIFKGLNWLGLEWDEDVVFQGERSGYHFQNALALVDSGAAYPCFCTTEDLAQQKAEQKDRFVYNGHCRTLSEEEVKAKLDASADAATGYVIRFKVPSDGETAWDDVVHGRIAFPNKDLGGDFIILRSDCSPIYNLAVVSDDIHMGITLVMRGDDHISNTPKQILLYEALGAKVPQFGHLPMIHGDDGKKLSKRHGATAVGDYADLGILPEAMNNFLALLGWSPGEDREVMSMEEMIKLFSLDRLSKKAAIFGLKKLEWMNKEHMNRMSLDDLTRRVDDLLPPPTFEPHVRTLVNLLRGRAKNMTDLKDTVYNYYVEHPVFDQTAVAKVWADPDLVVKVLKQAFAELTTTGTFMTTKENSQIIRLALSGKTVSPPFNEIIEALGVDAVKERLHHAIEKNLRLLYTI